MQHFDFSIYITLPRIALPSLLRETFILIDYLCQLLLLEKKKQIFLVYKTALKSHGGGGLATEAEVGIIYLHKELYTGWGVTLL